jgi:hypothetical protein
LHIDTNYEPVTVGVLHDHEIVGRYKTELQLEPQSSCTSFQTEENKSFASPSKSTISKASRLSKKPNRVKIIPWYFYPEFADKSLFKNRSAHMDLESVLNETHTLESQSQQSLHDRFSMLSTPVKQPRGIDLATEVGMSSSKKQRFEYDEVRQFSEKKLNT